jgi:hypothetical protein
MGLIILCTKAGKELPICPPDTSTIISHNSRTVSVPEGEHTSLTNSGAVSASEGALDSPTQAVSATTTLTNNSNYNPQAVSAPEGELDQTAAVSASHMPMAQHMILSNNDANTNNHPLYAIFSAPPHIRLSKSNDVSMVTYISYLHL